MAVAFVGHDEVTLLVAPSASEALQDADWVDERHRHYAVRRWSERRYRSSKPGHSVTIIDQDVAPVAKFKRTGILLTEEQRYVISDLLMSRVERPGPARVPTGLNAEATYGAYKVCPLAIPAPSLWTRRARPILKPPATVKRCCPSQTMRTPEAGVATAIDSLIFDTVGGFIHLWRRRNGDGVSVGDLAGPVDGSGDRTDDGGSIELRLQACGDNDFRDMDISLAFVDRAVWQARLGGTSSTGAPAMISIRSNDATPTVGFLLADRCFHRRGRISTTTLILSATGENSCRRDDGDSSRVEHDETDVSLYCKGGDNARA